ncbi:MAG: type II toxin-antitoxin system RelE/ParE family toxin, partial [Pseudomonadales bacterium]
MIQNFKHKGHENFFLQGTKAGSQIEHESRIRLILGRLHAATSPRDVHLPGLYLHELDGKSRGRWSARVSGNWR